MTMLVGLANGAYAILLADRRISVNGVSVHDEFNKLCFLFCEDARVACAYTGIAAVNGFIMSDWLVQTLSDIGKVYGDIHNILNELAARLVSLLHGLPANDKRLRIVFCGFVYWTADPQACAYVMSNYVDGQTIPFPTFNLASVPLNNGAIIEVLGAKAQFPAAVEEQLRSLLLAGLPPETVLRFVTKQLRNAAGNGGKFGTIGKQCNSAIIRAQRDTNSTATYHSDFKTHRAFGPGVVVTKSIVVWGTDIFAGTVLSGPDIAKKSPCWCGSGQKFKHCHLKKFGAVYVRTGPFKSPMTPVVGVELTNPRPSGRRFAVVGGYE